MLHNQQELYKCMDEEGLDYIIGTMPENVIYLSDFYSPNQGWIRGTFTAVIYPRDEAKRPVLVLSKSEAELMTTSPGWVNDVVFYGDAFINDTEKSGLNQADAALRDYLKQASFATPVEAMADAFKSLGLTASQKIGIDEKGVSAPVISALSAALGHELPYKSAVIGKARLIKTAEEVRRLGRAVTITEQSARAAMEMAVPGMAETELAAIYHGELVKRGAKPAMTCIGFASHSAHANAQPTDYIRLERNQPVRFDIGCVYKHYQADTAKIGVLGELRDDLYQNFDLLRKGIARGIDLIKPGVSSRTVFAAVMEYICEQLPHYRRSHVGHGIGIELYDPPTIGATDWCFREGMVMCVEAPYYELGVGGLQVEEVVHVTADGVEIMSERPVEIITA